LIREVAGVVFAVGEVKNRVVAVAEKMVAAFVVAATGEATAVVV